MKERDLTLNVLDYKLNIRAAGIIIHNGKVLVHKNVNDDYYALVGGRVEIGENSATTLKREIQEEILHEGKFPVHKINIDLLKKIHENKNVFINMDKKKMIKT